MSEPPKEHFVKVVWNDDKTGAAIVEGKPKIVTRIPPGSNETMQNFTPEDLFVAAGSVCFMNSFYHFTKKMHIVFKSFEVESVGYLEKVDRSFEVTRIHSKTKLVIESKELEKKFERALELGAKYCFISNSMKCPTTHEYEIVVE
ncbi:MAG: OsmC family protein [Candidatus Thorarchaeota archaeon]|jgi:organic hydroperoxide reductase OsmC/OhrA